MFDPTRRMVVRGGLVLSALLLAGCQRQNRWTPLTQAEMDGPPRLPPPPPRPRPAPVETPRTPTGVIARREWAGSGPNLAMINPMNGVGRITVHHDGMPPVSLRTKGDVADRLEQIRRAHTGHDWADIGYHYIIDPQGRVWEGRPVRYQGAHVKDNNEHNLGVMLLGNFDQQRPTQAALETLDAFLADRMRAYRVPLTRVYTHQEINTTACPGRSLQAYMEETRGRGGRLATVMS